MTKLYGWKILMPTISNNNYGEQISHINQILKNNTQEAIEEGLNKLIRTGALKSYKKDKVKYSKFSEQNSITIWDLKYKDYMDLKNYKYTLKIPLDSPLIKVNENNFRIQINYPWSIKYQEIKNKRLKSQKNLSVTFSLGIRFDKKPSKNDYYPHVSCNHEFELFYNGIWNWALIWTCSKCGYTGYCSCFKEVIEASKKGSIISKKIVKRNNEPYTNTSFVRFKNPENIIFKEKKFTLKDIGLKYDNLPYIDNACEICRNKTSTHNYCHKMYANSEFERKYGAYIKKTMYQLRLTGEYDEITDDKLERIANNRFRKELGFKKIGEKFVTETELFRIITSLYPEHEVIHHYKSPWLQGQEIDIFIPDLNIGIEYDGIQHFKAIDVWGGEEALKENQKRDSEKNKKCLENNIQLIRFNYKEKELLSEDYVSNKINSIIKQ